MSSLPTTSPELGHHSQVISDTVSFLSQIHFSFVCLKVVHYPGANLAVRETLCLQAFTCKQWQQSKLKAIFHHLEVGFLPSRRQGAGGSGLTGQVLCFAWMSCQQRVEFTFHI